MSNIGMVYMTYGTRDMGCLNPSLTAGPRHNRLLRGDARGADQVAPAGILHGDAPRKLFGGRTNGLLPQIR
jgi:hypothetical protein